MLLRLIRREGIFLSKNPILPQYIVVAYFEKNTDTVRAIYCNFFVRNCLAMIYSDLGHIMKSGI